MTASGVSTTQTASDTEGDVGEEAMPLTAQLFLVLEAARPRAGGARFSLSQTDEVWIGRGSHRTFSREGNGTGAARLKLTVPARTVSASHARLRNHRGHWSLQDLGSTNGTFLNGVRVTDAVLRDRDLIELGHTFFVFREGLPTPPLTPTDVELGGVELEPAPVSLLPAEAEQLRVLSSIARTKLPVLLLGETGTGKEVLARAIHRYSGRPGAFVALNCGALSPTLLDAQLFGHCRGSFSGAARDEPGLVRAADRGTLLLDEVGDMPAAAQVALLRVLQESEVLPVGAAKAQPVDVRVVAATHQPLAQLVASGAFRSDLLARLHGHVHALPALRQRREDLGVLLANVLGTIDPEQRLTRLSPEAARVLLLTPWPLNVRQLTQSLSRALALATDDVLRASNLEPSPVERGSSSSALEPPAEARLSADEEQLRARLVGLLSAERGNVTEVARHLGKARMQVQRWMKRFGVDPAVYRH
ncbi:MAG: FHA domain-containing protein [Myxococcales bacterium]|nr:MAG: FHA domain-containing protein [Myxococcales bacterium]